MSQPWNQKDSLVAWIRGMGHIIGGLHSDGVEKDDVAQQHEYSYQQSG